jgi:hypothetical protein
MKPTMTDEVLALALRDKVEQCQEDIRTYMDGRPAYMIDALCNIVVNNFLINEKKNTLRDSV